MSIFSAVAKFLAGLVTAFNAWLRERERKAHIDAGRRQQELANRDKTDEAEGAMDAVPPPTSDEVDQDLKDGKF